uniref:Saf-pilin pilus formation protein n=1 Tax=Enterobacter cloacae TaxID=550 RepID=A0A1S6XY49_ENTCL|nr:hypothetical protein [Enterobacter cloacae]AQX35347.1 hypothetical protein PIMI5_00028 [Enterobacter cloacae]
MKLSKCLVGMMLLTTSASSLAAFDRVTTTSGNITFTAPTYPVTTTITPVANLTSGEQSAVTKLADVAYSSPQPQRIAYRWGPATAKFQPSPSRTGVATIKGNSNNNNQLTAVFSPPFSASLVPDVDGTNWNATNNPVTSLTNSILTPSSAIIVNPDTYTVYIESGVYVP